MAGLLAADAEGRWVWSLAGPGGERQTICFADASAVLQAFAAPRSAGAGKAAPAPIAEKQVVPLERDELQAVRRWQEAAAQRSGHDVLRLPDGGVAVSHALANASHPDLSALLRAFDRRGWLGRGDWPARGARIGLVPFAAGRHPGFVLTAQAARLLGLVA
jgi:hypothetical protein